MNTNISNESTVLHISNDFLYDKNNVFYIDNTKQLKDNYKIIKINYIKYHTLSYNEVINHLDKFHVLFLDTFNNISDISDIPKILVLIDVFLLKQTINLNNSSMYNTNLLNLIKYVNIHFNDYIDKCITVNCNDVEKGLIIFFKTIFKHIQFVNKITVYTK